MFLVIPLYVRSITMFCSHNLISYLTLPWLVITLFVFNQRPTRDPHPRIFSHRTDESSAKRTRMIERPSRGIGLQYTARAPQKCLLIKHASASGRGHLWKWLNERARMRGGSFRTASQKRNEMHAALEIYGSGIVPCRAPPPNIIIRANFNNYRGNKTTVRRVAS